MRRLEDLSAAELERLFPPRRPLPKSLPPATPPVAIVHPVAVPRLIPDAKPVVRKPRGRAPRPPAFHVDGRRCQTCRRPWVETSRVGSTACPFCGADR